jgi:hypothetical protein
MFANCAGSSCSASGIGVEESPIPPNIQPHIRLEEWSFVWEDIAIKSAQTENGARATAAIVIQIQRLDRRSDNSGHNQA